MLKQWSCLRLKRATNKKADSVRNAEFVRFSFATIISATANFSATNRLGHGQLGVVYKGTLKSGKEIAIKRLHRDLDLSTEVFVAESSVVARIQHTNLVKHLGFCSEGNEKILIYEFLPNASLTSLLFDPRKQVLITWETCYKIILGVAKGLEYLHEGTNSQMLHHRLQIRNVLLDEEMNPKIADFGMNKIFERRRQHVNTSSTAIASYVCIAPEYFSTGRYSAKSDVYSFGVIVLETVVDLKKVTSTRSRIATAHRIQARKLWEEDRLSELINPALSAKCPETDVIRCIQVALLCVQEDEEHRPTMGEVILMLTGKVDIPLPSTGLI